MQLAHQTKRRKMMNKQWLPILAGITILAITALPANAKTLERDPFSPYAWEKPSNVVEVDPLIGRTTEFTTPLTENALSTYKVVGTMISPKDALALVRTKDKREFFVSHGDPIGREGGEITVINIDGVTVDISGKIIDLTVNNNSFEAGNDAIN